MFDLKNYLGDENEKPLDRLVQDGGMCRIFRKIGCIGDSLSSGEHESLDENGNKGFHDFYDYSWGQVLARNTGATVYNFSVGGLKAKDFIEGFADSRAVFNTDKLCQCYIIALGVNDLVVDKYVLGTVDDLDIKSPNKSKTTFAGYYGRIIHKIKQAQKDAKIFLITLPNQDEYPSYGMTKLLYDFSEKFDNTYCIDLEKYGPVYDAEFKKKFFVSGHMNAAGYVLSAQMITSYIDYIIRHNLEEFSLTGFIGTPYTNINYK